MSPLALTIILSTVLMILVVAGLSIGMLLTGKSRLRRGCGYSPRKKDSSCSLCDNKQSCDKKDKE